MVRLLLLLILVMLLYQSLSRLWRGVVRGMQGQDDRGYSGPRRTPAPQGVQMARDPVCGTFVVPDRAIALSAPGGPFYFCSTACRDKYRANPQAGPVPAHGRTA